MSSALVEEFNKTLTTSGGTTSASMTLPRMACAATRLSLFNFVTRACARSSLISSQASIILSWNSSRNVCIDRRFWLQRLSSSCSDATLSAVVVCGEVFPPISEDGCGSSPNRNRPIRSSQTSRIASLVARSDAWKTAMALPPLLLPAAVERSWGSAAASCWEEDAVLLRYLFYLS